MGGFMCVSPLCYSQRVNLLFSGQVFWLLTLWWAHGKETCQENWCLCLRSSLLGHKTHECSTSQNDGKWFSKEIELIYIPLIVTEHLFICLLAIYYFPFQWNTPVFCSFLISFCFSYWYVEILHIFWILVSCQWYVFQISTSSWLIFPLYLFMNRTS